MHVPAQLVQGMLRACGGDQLRTATCLRVPAAGKAAEAGEVGAGAVHVNQIADIGQHILEERQELGLEAADMLQQGLVGLPIRLAGRAASVEHQMELEAAPGVHGHRGLGEAALRDCGLDERQRGVLGGV